MIPILSILVHILYAPKSPPPYPIAIGDIAMWHTLSAARFIAMWVGAIVTHIAILLQGHLYVPPEDPTEDDTMGSEDFADQTPIPLLKRKGATTEATKATKRVALTCSFAIADLAAETL